DVCSMTGKGQIVQKRRSLLGAITTMAPATSSRGGSTCGKKLAIAMATRVPVAMAITATLIVGLGTSAHADPTPPENTIVMTDTPPPGEVLAPPGPNCGGITDPCGIVYNRTGGTLELSRDANSHFACGAIGPFRDLPNGQNSNAYGWPHWPDVDCVRSRSAYIVTNGRLYAPGKWIRIWTSHWFFGV
ncbi:hypothetical protein, partial [Streptosporangium sp. NPDC004631]